MGHPGEPIRGVEPEGEDLLQDRGRGYQAIEGKHRCLHFSIISCSSTRGRAKCAMSPCQHHCRSMVRGICRSRTLSRKPNGALLSQLKQRGMQGVQLIISDVCMEPVESATESVPKTLGHC